MEDIRMPNIFKPKYNPDYHLIDYVAMGWRKNIDYLNEKFAYLSDVLKGKPFRITLAYSKTRILSNHFGVNYYAIQNNRIPVQLEFDTQVYLDQFDCEVVFSHTDIVTEESGNKAFVIQLMPYSFEEGLFPTIRNTFTKAGATWHLNNGVYHPYIKVCNYTPELEEQFLNTNVNGDVAHFTDLVCSCFAEHNDY